MMKSIILFLIIFLNYKYAIGRNVGETEITTDDGIEVFQEEKENSIKNNKNDLLRITLRANTVVSSTEQMTFSIDKDNGILFNWEKVLLLIPVQ